MYFAVREIKTQVIGADGRRRVVVIPPDAPVEQAAEWPYATIIAHLNLGLIKWKADGAEEAPHLHPKLAKVVDVNAYRNAGRRPRPVDPEPNLNAPCNSGDFSTPVPAKVAATPSAPSVGEAARKEAASPTLTCCGRLFKTAAAMSSHQRAKHAQGKSPGAA